ncbi:RimJ/RimL family protein N-acetyltransferase [Sediminihabitans luteus]|uniref:RimJ/RimL family protein N-acetyltransferase n=1 Tax=Sediminihabitans luteus TaxID=1138585 RepID=A0A2M9CCL8_9CELL|nr:GNAT family protein [Sediminihabitans luteus]PJJ69100.1 RimJ/RimL family protein N-acetyltransferase [Sediminihabitans luteus]GII99486.1 N-acetyltransferase [Sediminihabitans luteus]
MTAGRVLPVVGERCVLRAGREDDEAMLREWLRPHHEWNRWDAPYLPRATDAEAARYAHAVAHPPADDGTGLPPSRAVVADPASGELLGVVSWYWESEPTGWARLGVVLYDPAVRGQGIGREALALWTSLLFDRTDWVRLDLATWSGNTAMCATARSLGFVEEARFRDARVVGGVRYDSVAYGVLRDEWARSGG